MKQHVNQKASLNVIRKGSKTGEQAAYDFFWVPAVLLFGVGDILITQLALRFGAVEGNNIVRFLIDDIAGGFWTFAMVKATILLTLLFISFPALGRFRWVVPCFLCCAGAYLLAGNLSVIFALL